MALKPCRECKTEISTRAKTCPHCGLKRPHDLAIQHWLHTVGNQLILWGAILTVLAIILL